MDNFIKFCKIQELENLATRMEILVGSGIDDIDDTYNSAVWDCIDLIAKRTEEIRSEQSTKSIGNG